MTEQAIVEGHRTITRHPEAPQDALWWGKIAAPGYPGRVWKADCPEQVERQMNQSLGRVDTKQYAVTE